MLCDRQLSLVPIGNIHILEASPSVTREESEALPVVFVHGMADEGEHLG
ncbi:MAG: hypothetical protein WCD53_30600 [Microcoleus sp.]